MSLLKMNVLPCLGFCVVFTNSPVAYTTEMIGAPGAEDHLINYLMLSGLSTSAGLIASVLYFYFSAPGQHHHHHHHKKKSLPRLPLVDTTHNSLSDDPPPPPLANSPRDLGKHI